MAGRPLRRKTPVGFFTPSAAEPYERMGTVSVDEPVSS
jgi:hypothetical protein